MKPDGYDQKGVPVYDRPVMVVDVWSILNTGQVAGPDCAFGLATPDNIKRVMGSPPDIETDQYAPDVPWRTEHGALAFTFDDKRLLSGVYFGGDFGETLPQGIEQAAAQTDEFGDIQKSCDIWAGQTGAVVRLAGRPGSSFATLPRFITCMPADVALSLSAMPMRKSLSIEVRHALRRLKAEFILKAFKLDYSEPFHVDYCLHTLSVTVDT